MTTPRTIPTLSREQARRVDQIAIDDLAIPGIVLMENAAAALELAALRLLADSNGAGPGSVIIAAGPGNNGGDGLALARRLHNKHIPVVILLAAPETSYTGDALANLDIAKRLALPIVPLDPDAAEPSLRRALERAGRIAMVVDALLGTGATSAPRPPIDAAIRWINRLGEGGAWVLAADLPTGLDADSGQPLGPPDLVVDADATVTLAAMKPGLLTPAGRRFAGKVTVGDIGVPLAAIQRAAES